MRGSLRPLRIRAFTRLATSYTLNELGDWFGSVALAVLIYDETKSPLATSVLFLASKFTPAFFVPAFVSRVDQLATRRALPTLYLAEALAFFLLAATADSFLLPLILVLAFLDGTLALTGRALTRAAIALVLEPANELRAGNALVNVAFAVAATAGPALAGVVVGSVGVATALALDGALFLVMALIVATTTGLPDAHPEPQPWRTRLREGLRHLGANRLVRLMLAGQALALVFFSMIIPLEVVYAKDALGTGDAGFGALLAAWGGGIVLGSLIFTAAHRRSPALLIVPSTAAVGLSYLGMAATDSLVVACALGVVGGTGNGVQWVAVITALQEATDSAYQGRLSSLIESMNAAMPGLGFMLGGAVAAIADVRLAYVVAGAGVLALVAAAPLVLAPVRAAEPAERGL